MNADTSEHYLLLTENKKIKNVYPGKYLHKFSFPSLRTASSIVLFLNFLQIVHCTLRDHSTVVIIAASQLIQRCANVRN